MHEHSGAPTVFVGQLIECRVAFKSLRTETCPSTKTVVNFTYRIAALGEKGATLSDLGAEGVGADAKETLLEIAYTDLHKNFRPSYAHTGHSSQGLTIEGDITVFGAHLTDSFDNPEWLYVACSRMRSFNQLFYFCGEPQPHGKTLADLKRVIAAKIRALLRTDSLKGCVVEDPITVDSVLDMLRTKKGSRAEWHRTCPTCSRTMQLLYDAKDDDQWSIDRIENERDGARLGHSRGNVQITCLRCNKSKH